MAKNHEKDTTIMLWLKGYRVGKVTEDKAGIIAVVRARQGKTSCHRCGSAKLYRHGLGRNDKRERQ